MIISQDIWNVSTGVTLVRSGNEVTLSLAGSASGYYNPDLGYWEWFGWMEAQFGTQSGYTEQFFDRLMELSLTETLTVGTVTTGNYYVEGSPSESVEFGVVIFDTAAVYVGTLGVDYVFGSGTADQLSGSGGDDGLDGADGNDWLHGGAGGDHLEGGNGQDTASYAGASTGVVARLYSESLGTGDAAGDRYVSIERLEGSSFSDHLYGDSKKNTLWGRDGADTLFGRGGNDVLSGGKGADLLYGDAGFDRVSYEDSSVAVRASLTAGKGKMGDAEGDEYTGVEALTGTSFDDVLTGDHANNDLQGLNGDDLLRGLAGNDSLNGGSGDDVLVGAAGSDMLVGGLGMDTASYAGAATGVTVDLENAALNTGEAAGDIFVSVENIRGTAFADTLSGNALENEINGGSGDDTVNGGGASDRLWGGIGSDTFVFDSPLDELNNLDTIYDFSADEDRIALDIEVFANLAGDGVLDAAAFATGAGATTEAHRIIYDPTNGRILYDADGVGSAEAVAFARMSPRLDITAEDFVLN